MNKQNLKDGFKELNQTIGSNISLYNSFDSEDIEIDKEGLLHNIITIPISFALGLVECEKQYKNFLFNALYNIRLNGGVVVLKDKLKAVSLDKLTIHDIDINPLSDTYLYPQKIVNTINGEDITERSFLMYAFASDAYSEAHQRGASVFEHVKSAYVSYINALTSSSKIITNMNTEIYKLEGLLDMIDSPQALSALTERLKFINLGKSQSVVLIDSQDSFEVHSQSLSGVDKVILAHQVNLCSVAQIPYSILFGKNTGGLNSNDTFDNEKFYNYVRYNLVDRYIVPLSEVLGFKITVKEFKDFSMGAGSNKG